LSDHPLDTTDDGIDLSNEGSVIMAVEVLPDAPTQTLGFAHIDHPVPTVVHQVTAGGLRHAFHIVL
jgi:hypothetical protein